MALNLGLESLNSNIGQEQINDQELLADIMNMDYASEQINELGVLLDNAIITFDNLTDIKKSINKYGVTESLIALVGNVIGSCEANNELVKVPNADDASKEVDAKKSGVWSKIKEACIKMWNWIKAFFIYWFKTSEGLIKKAKDWITRAKESNTELSNPRPFNGIEDSKVTTIGSRVEDALTKGDIGTVEDIKEDEIATYVKKEFKTKTEAIRYISAIVRGTEELKNLKAHFASTIDKEIKMIKDEKPDDDDGKTAKKNKLETSSSKAKQIKKLATGGLKKALHTIANFLVANKLKKTA